MLFVMSFIDETVQTITWNCRCRPRESKPSAFCLWGRSVSDELPGRQNLYPFVGFRFSRKKLSWAMKSFKIFTVIVSVYGLKPFSHKINSFKPRTHFSLFLVILLFWINKFTIFKPGEKCMLRSNYYSQYFSLNWFPVIYHEHTGNILHIS